MQPNILVYSHEIPQTGTAGGLLLYRLLRTYPPGRISVIGAAPATDSALLHCSYAALQMPWRRFEYSRANQMHRTLRAFGLVPLFSPVSAESILGAFRPDVVVTVMQHGTWYDSALKFARSKGIPLVAIVHDVNESFDRVYSWARSFQRRRDGMFYRYASRRLCVSPEMELHCRAKYGVAGDVLYPSRGDDLQPRPLEECKTLKKDGRLTLGFAGNLNYGYGRQLVRLLPSLRAANAHLIIFSRPPGAESAELARANDCIDLRGFAPSAKVWSIIKDECDALILPYSNPSGELRTLYSNHFPSKLVEYMALQMPIIVVGPPEATGVRFARNHPESLLCETSESSQDIVKIFTLLREDSSLRCVIAANSRRLAVTEFDPDRLRDQFFRCLEEATSTHRPPST